MNIEELINDLAKKTIELSIEEDNAKGELLDHFHSCINEKNNDLPFSPLFTEKLRKCFVELSKNIQRLNTETGYYNHRPGLLNFDESNLLWRFIKREFPFKIRNEEARETDKLELVDNGGFFMPITSNYLELYVCHELTKDIEVLKLINKNRKGVNLEEF